MGVDFAVLALAVSRGIPVPISVSVALVAALTLHFALNRYINFRNFDRTLLQQVRTYIVLAVLVLSFSVLWIQALVAWFSMPVLVAKALSMPFTLGIGYLSARDLTFGAGISRRVSGWLSRR